MRLLQLDHEEIIKEVAEAEVYLKAVLMKGI